MQKNASATVPGVVAESNADTLAGDHYKDLIHDVRVRCADGMAQRIQHAQDRADAAHLRNKYFLENEEKVATDDDSFATPGTVAFVRNGSEVSHGCIILFQCMITKKVY